MFEKEAEEWAKETMDCVKTENCLNQDCNYFSDEERIIAKSAFEDGAEFGYNKANEWHNQNMDDIYISISKDWGIRHFICIMNDKSLNTATGNCDEGCNGEVSVNLAFDYNDEKYLMDDIMWWKEIILPKETENDKG